MEEESDRTRESQAETVGECAAPVPEMPTPAPAPEAPIPARAITVAGLRLPGYPLTYTMPVRLSGVRVGDELLVETRQGETTARVVFMRSSAEDEVHFTGPLLRITRRMRPQDRDALAKRGENERRALLLCREKAKELGLVMRVSRVVWRLDENKAIFHFTSESRVDFRELVKRLSHELRIRVEMRQIGVRDETRLLGGLGPCGLVVCCRHMGEFRPVSVRMAKSQDLSLNPDAISGLCGRLLCCLAYEESVYQELRKGLPKTGTLFFTAEGRQGMVKTLSILKGKVHCKMEDGEMVELEPSQLLATRPEGLPPPVQPGSDAPAAAPSSPPPPSRPRPPRLSAPRPRPTPEASPTSARQENRRPAAAAPPPAPPPAAAPTQAAPQPPPPGEGEEGAAASPARRRRRRRRSGSRAGEGGAQEPISGQDPNE